MDLGLSLLPFAFCVLTFDLFFILFLIPFVISCPARSKKSGGENFLPLIKNQSKTDYVVGTVNPFISFDSPPWQLRQNCATALPPAAGVYWPFRKNMV